MGRRDGGSAASYRYRGTGPGGVEERERGGRAYARAIRRLDAPERYWVTIQYRRAEGDPARGRTARVLNPRSDRTKVTTEFP